MSVLTSKKSQMKVIYFSLVTLLFFCASKSYFIPRQVDAQRIDDWDNCLRLDYTMITSLTNKYATRSLISFELIMNNQIIRTLFSSVNVSLYRQILNYDISQMTMNFFEWGEFFGIGGTINGTLLLLATFSIDFQEEKKESRNRNRLIIKSIISQYPGINLREIQRTSNLAMGVIQYHLRYLESDGIREIESLRHGRCKHFFESYKFNQREKVWFSLNRNQNIKSILDLLENDQCTQKDLSQLTGISKSLTSYYIKNLERNGLVERENNQLRISRDFEDL
ncbi:MAG: winged helix-turn-helix transcriptional regulator [Candidatus Heimdallarchaeota archaeon]|nr:MAG: winged helix-turn-helix transcriptional regulator [Candidatus Heimdallarchaeota archaeon]